MASSKLIESWVQRIDKQEMPIFKASVSAIAHMASKSETSASELASTILRDPSLAARILKFANSQFYRTALVSSINTVSHAVVILGFEVVQELSLSLSIIDSLLANDIRENLAKSLASSFLAAVHARAVAEKMGRSNLEEVFIAALLYDLGEMAFWCIASQDEVEKLEKAMASKEPEAAQRQALGFRFRDLTWHLVKRWNLRSPLEEALKDEGHSSEMGKIIHYAKELAAIATSDFEADEEGKKLKGIAKFLRMAPDDLKKMVDVNVKMATEIGHAYSPVILKYLSGQIKQGLSHPEPKPPVAFPEPDPHLQLKILRELSTMLRNKHDLNLIIETLLEGVYHGVGMDRALFALYNGKEAVVKAKFVLAAQGDLLMEQFVFPVGKDPENPFNDVLFERQQGIWVRNTRLTSYRPDIMRKIRSILDVRAFFLTPIIVNGHPIGIFYADRQPSGRPLDEESFANFEHFGQQAGISIEHISYKGK